MKKILTFIKTILKGIENAQMAKAKDYIRFHNKGIFKHHWD